MSEPTPPRVFGLAKVFSEEHHAKAMLERGQLHMKSVAWFRALEDDGSGRADPDDSIDRLIQPEGTSIFVKTDGTGEDYVGPGMSLAKPIKLRTAAGTDSHIFCAYLIGEEHRRRAFRSEPVVDSRLADLGAFAVLVHDVEGFVRRTVAAARALSLGVLGNVVEYVDLNTYEGEVGPFMKDLRFSYQHEYRIRVGGRGEDHLNLELGPLFDVARLVSGAELADEAARVCTNASSSEGASETEPTPV